MTYILDFLKVLYFFPGWLCNFKGLPYLFGGKFTGRKFYQWCHDNWTIGQWVISHYAPDTVYVNLFSPAWIYMIQIHSGERSQPWDFVARPVAQQPHALKLTHFYDLIYERSTCSLFWRLHALNNLLVVADTLNIAKIFTVCPIKQQHLVTLSFSYRSLLNGWVPPLRLDKTLDYPCKPPGVYFKIKGEFNMRLTVT